jgi:hypothetical protein
MDNELVSSFNVFVKQVKHTFGQPFFSLLYRSEKWLFILVTCKQYINYKFDLEKGETLKGNK